MKILALLLNANIHHEIILQKKNPKKSKEQTVPFPRNRPNNYYYTNTSPKLKIHHIYTSLNIWLIGIPYAKHL